MKDAVFPLAMVSTGECVRLEDIHGGEKLTQRLTALGLTPGVELSILQDNGGALLVSVRDSRIALGRGMAHKVMVRTIESNDNEIIGEGEIHEAPLTGPTHPGGAGRQPERRKKHHFQRSNWFSPTRR